MCNLKEKYLCHHTNDVTKSFWYVNVVYLLFFFVKNHLQAFILSYLLFIMQNIVCSSPPFLQILQLLCRFSWFYWRTVNDFVFDNSRFLYKLLFLRCNIKLRLFMWFITIIGYCLIKMSNHIISDIIILKRARNLLFCFCKISFSYSWP